MISPLGGGENNLCEAVGVVKMVLYCADNEWLIAFVGKFFEIFLVCEIFIAYLCPHEIRQRESGSFLAKKRWFKIAEFRNEKRNAYKNEVNVWRQIGDLYGMND